MGEKEIMLESITKRSSLVLNNFKCPLFDGLEKKAKRKCIAKKCKTIQETFRDGNNYQLMFICLSLLNSLPYDNFLDQTQSVCR